MTEPRITYTTARVPPEIMELHASLIVCDFLRRMAMPKDLGRMIFEINEKIDDELTRKMLGVD